MDIWVRLASMIVQKIAEFFIKIHIRVKHEILCEQFVQLYQQGKYEEAKKIANKAYELDNKYPGEFLQQHAKSRDNLALINHAMGNDIEAELFYREALPLYRSALYNKYQEVAKNLNNKLEKLIRLFEPGKGDYKPAEPFFRLITNVYRMALNGENSEIDQILTNLADQYVTLGKYVAAESILKQIKKLREESLGDNHPGVAQTLNSLGRLYYFMGNYTIAESLYRQAIEIRRTALGENHSDFSESLNNLALLYHAMGDYAVAKQLYCQALTIRRNTLGKYHPGVVESINNLALLYHAMGNYAEAELLYKDVLENHSKTPNEKHPNIAATKENLANLYYAMSNYATAEVLYQDVVEIKRRTLGENHPEYATSLNNLATLHRAMGNYTTAEPLFQQALEIVRTILGEKHPAVAKSQINLAAIYVATDRADEALFKIEHVIAINKQMIGQIFSAGSENQRMAYLKISQNNIDFLLSLSSKYLCHSPNAVFSALEQILWRKAIAAEALAIQRDTVLGGRYPTLEPRLRELMNLRMKIGQKAIAGPGPEGSENHQKVLAEWNAQKEHLEAELARQIPEMNLENKLRAADRQTMAKTLPSESVLIEFVKFNVYNYNAMPAQGEVEWKPPEYLVFVLPSGEPNKLQMIDLGLVELIDRLIANFRVHITGETENRYPRHLKAIPFELNETTNTSDGTALRAAIFDPLISALGGRKRLLIALDGDLNRLPFEILPTDDGRRLIDEYQISYLGTGRDLMRFESAIIRQPTEPIVAADPDFNIGGDGTSPSVEVSARGRHSRDFNRSSLYFDRLPGTRLEGECIAALLNVQPLLEGKVLEAKLKACRSPRILHIATHGFFLSDQKHDLNKEQFGLGTIGDRMGRLLGPGLENPLLRSGLALAGANTWLQEKPLPPEAEDGILTAEDVSGMDLLDTDLVVLSACETGLGEVQVGEGVFGLRRAFVLAGAKTLVMSLWKVPDQQTQELMEDFYRRILAGQPRAEALRQAQLAMKAKYPDPYYWGAFICQGDPGPLQKR